MQGWNGLVPVSNWATTTVRRLPGAGAKGSLPFSGTVVVPGPAAGPGPEAGRDEVPVALFDRAEVVRGPSSASASAAPRSAGVASGRSTWMQPGMAKANIATSARAALAMGRPPARWLGKGCGGAFFRLGSAALPPASDDQQPGGRGGDHQPRRAGMQRRIAGMQERRRMQDRPPVIDVD